MPVIYHAQLFLTDRFGVALTHNTIFSTAFSYMMTYTRFLGDTHHLSETPLVHRSDSVYPLAPDSPQLDAVRDDVKSRVRAREYLQKPLKRRVPSTIQNAIFRG